VFKDNSSTTVKSGTFAWSGQNLGFDNSTDAYRSLHALDFILLQLHILIPRVDLFLLIKWKEI
jgi:hypothetical protein